MLGYNFFSSDLKAELQEDIKKKKKLKQHHIPELIIKCIFKCMQTKYLNLCSRALTGDQQLTQEWENDINLDQGSQNTIPQAIYSPQNDYK